MHAIARVWMACRVRLGPRHFAGRRTPAPAQQRPMPPRDLPGRKGVRGRGVSTTCALRRPPALPVPLEVTGRPRRFRQDAAGRWLPTCRVLGARAAPVQRRHTEHNGHGWMDAYASIQNPKPDPAAAVSSCGRASRAHNARGKSAARGCATARDDANGAGIPRPHGSACQFAGDKCQSRLFRRRQARLIQSLCQSRPKRFI